MKPQETQLDVLKIMVAIQESSSVDVVEDTELAEAMELDLNVVQNSMQTLADDGYVRLEKVDRLSGSGYIASLTSEGRAATDGELSQV